MECEDLKVLNWGCGVLRWGRYQTLCRMARAVHMHSHKAIIEKGHVVQQ